MEELKITGIVTSCVNYGERDKIINIFSLELGKLSATLKSVNASCEKLMFAAHVFCFAEFVLAKKSNGYVVTSCNLIDSFYDLSEDYNKLLIGCAMLEISNANLNAGEINEPLFVFLLKSLKELTYSGVQENLVCVKFMLEVLQLMGYGVQFGNCAKCNMPIMHKIFFDVATGEILCETCKTLTSLELTKQEYAMLKIISNASLENLQTIKCDVSVLKSLQNVLKQNIQHKLSKKIKSLN